MMLVMLIIVGNAIAHIYTSWVITMWRCLFLLAHVYIAYCIFYKRIRVHYTLYKLVLSDIKISDYGRYFCRYFEQIKSLIFKEIRINFISHFEIFYFVIFRASNLLEREVNGVVELTGSKSAPKLSKSSHNHYPSLFLSCNSKKERENRLLWRS